MVNLYKSNTKNTNMHANAFFSAQLTPNEWYRIISQFFTDGVEDDEKLSWWLEHLIDEKKIDLNVPVDKSTWLSLMVTFGKINLMRLLLRKGANVQLGCPRSGMTPIVVAVMMSGRDWDESTKSDIIKLIVENDRTVLNTLYRGKNLLYYCYETETGFEGISLLLDLGFDINMKNCDQLHGELSNYSTLFYAAYELNYELFNFLLARGANPNDHADFTEVQMGNGHKTIESKSILHYITCRDLTREQDRLRHMENLLRAGAEVDGRDVFGRTCLWYVAQRCLLRSCNLLLQYGANPNKRCRMQYGNFSPLDKAPDALKNHMLQVIRDRRLSTQLALSTQGLPPELLHDFIMPEL
jgi:hypothetical protein